MTIETLDTMSNVNDDDDGNGTGLQDEQIDSPDEIKDPFDPEEVKIRTVNIVVAQLVVSHAWNQRDRGDGVWFGRPGC